MSVGVIALFLLLGLAVTTLPGMPRTIGGWRWKRNQRLGYVARAWPSTPRAADAGLALARAAYDRAPSAGISAARRCRRDRTLARRDPRAPTPLLTAAVSRVALDI